MSWLYSSFLVSGVCVLSENTWLWHSIWEVLLCVWWHLHPLTTRLSSNSKWKKVVMWSVLLPGRLRRRSGCGGCGGWHAANCLGARVGCFRPIFQKLIKLWKAQIQCVNIWSKWELLLLFLHQNSGNERRTYLHWTLPRWLKTALPVFPSTIKHKDALPNSALYPFQNDTICRKTGLPYHWITICQYRSAPTFWLVASKRKIQTTGLTLKRFSYIYTINPTCCTFIPQELFGSNLLF